MRRPQFTLKSLLWLMAVVAAFLGGRAADSDATLANELRLLDALVCKEKLVEAHALVSKVHGFFLAGVAVLVAGLTLGATTYKLPKGIGLISTAVLLTVAVFAFELVVWIDNWP